MPDDLFPVVWKGRRAIVTFPEDVNVSNAGRLREQLLAVINRGAAALIADMTDTVSCDHSAVDALARAYQRAAVSGSQLRLVVVAPVVRRVLSIEGLDRLVSIYPSLEAAIAAGTPGSDIPARLQVKARPNGSAPKASSDIPGMRAITPVVLWQLIDALGDGLALTGNDGEIVLVNQRCAEMFGYERKELIGRLVDSLVPFDVQAAHQGYRAAYNQAPQARPMGERARLAGLRKDGATLPVEISLSPVLTATDNFVLAVIRDATEARRRDDLADLARAAVTGQSRRMQDLLDRVVHRLFQVGLSLQAAADVPGVEARERISEALVLLDDTIREIRDYALTSRDEGPLPEPGPPSDAT
jgi:anti-anti-sigma factor